VASLLAAPALAQQPGCAVYTRARQQTVSPQNAIALLKEGNGRFVSGHTVNCDLMKQVRETAGGQAPFAAIVGCIDSRVPPEFVFDQRIGDIFCARVAGNFVNVDILGSLEYACEVAGAKAIVVLGHTSCGAIKSAIDGVKLGHITAMLDNLGPAVDSAGHIAGAHKSDNPAFVQSVAEANARLTAASLTRRCAVLKQRVEAGNLTITAAMHDLATGRVSWLA
jgi:carbonic anhydrase